MFWKAELLFTFWLCLYSAIITRFEQNKYYKLMYSTLIIFWAIAYFYLQVFVSQYGGLYPFKFY